jgi:hypothetical protein
MDSDKEKLLARMRAIVEKHLDGVVTFEQGHALIDDLTALFAAPSPAQAVDGEPKQLVTYREVDDTLHAFYENGVGLGVLYREVDGFWVYAPELHGGFWTAHVMRAIADELDRRNKPWEDEINAYFARSAPEAGRPAAPREEQ